MLIVGGGHNGLMLAARLKRLGVSALVIDALEKPGDGWRARYHSLYLHDPIFLDHFPICPSRTTGRSTPPRTRSPTGSKLYAKAMEIDFWGGTRCTAARYDAATRRVGGDGHAQGGNRDADAAAQAAGARDGLIRRKEYPGHPGAGRFRGQVTITAPIIAAARDFAGKRCIVIGSNNSAHDICRRSLGA